MSNAPDLTEQKLIATARLAAIVESSEDAIISKTLEGVITSWNRGAERIYGYTEVEMLGRPVSLLVPAGREDEVPRLLSKLMAGEHVEHYETRRRKKDGQVIDMSLTLSPVRNAQGRIIAASSIGRDITERKQAQRDLALLSFAVNKVREAAFLIDRHACFQFVNEESCRVLGYTRAELLVMGVPDIDPDFPAEVWPSHWQDLKERGSLVFEGRHRTKDGRILQVEINANYLEYDGQSYNLALVREIGERKRAEEALRTSEERYRVAQSIGHVGNWEYDLQTGRFWGSDEAKRIYGFDLDQADFATDEVERCIAERERVHQALIDLIEGDKPYNLEFEIRPRNATESRIISSRARLQRDDHGTPRLVAGVIQDITERKQAESALRRLNRELEAISECSHALLRAADEQSLLAEICGIICEKTGYLMAWVGYAENDAGKTVRPVAWTGFKSGHVTNVTVSWAHDAPHGQGLAGTVIRSGNRACIQDLVADPSLAPWREIVERYGYRSGAGFPLKDEHARAFGVLLIYAGEVNAFSRDELRLLEELASDLAFGVKVLRDRSNRQRAERALQEKTAELDRYFTDALDLLCIADTEGHFRRLNPQWEACLGYPIPELEGQRFLDFVHPDDRAATIQATSLLARQNEVTGFTNRFRCRDGSYRWIEWRSFPSGARIHAVARDITERIRAEENLRKLNQELDQRVKERTVALENKNKELERMNRLFVGRELRMIELKDRIQKLEAQSGLSSGPTSAPTA